MNHKDQSFANITIKLAIKIYTFLLTNNYEQLNKVLFQKRFKRYNYSHNRKRNNTFNTSHKILCLSVDYP